MKKLLSCLLASIMMLLVMVVPSYDVHAANVSLSVSASSVDIGDTVTVTASVPGGITAKVDIYFSTGLFEFVSASGTANRNGGTVATTLGEPFSSSITVKLKAKTTGTGTITASVIQAGDSNTGDATTLGGASKSVTIANKVVPEPEPPKESEKPADSQKPTQPETPADSQKPIQPQTPTDSQKPTQSETAKSGDSSLSSLKISEGKLSPSFKSNVTKYTATVDYDVTKLVVSATPSNKKASIESVTGNGKVSLNVGSNTIKVVVKAENGVQTTYTLDVTRKEKEIESSETTSSETQASETPSSETQSEQTETPVEEQTFEYNGQTLNIIEEIPNKIVPSDFSKEKIVIDGKEVSGLKFAKGELQLLYLGDENSSLYMYDKKSGDIYPFIKIVFEQNYIILIRPDDETIPEGFVPCTVSIEGIGTVQAYQYNTETAVKEEKTGLFGAETYFATEQNLSELYFLYCVNNRGEYGWYQFDNTEKTFQRYFGTIGLVQNQSIEGQSTGNQSDNLPLSPQTKNDYESQIKALKSKIKILISVIIVAILGVVGKVVYPYFLKQKLVKQSNSVYVYEEPKDAEIKEDNISLESVQTKDAVTVMDSHKVEIACVKDDTKGQKESKLDNEVETEFFEKTQKNMRTMEFEDKVTASTHEMQKDAELKQSQKKEVTKSDSDENELEFIQF